MDKAGQYSSRACFPLRTADFPQLLAVFVNRVDSLVREYSRFLSIFIAAKPQLGIMAKGLPKQPWL
jgi:hypothetical protein